MRSGSEPFSETDVSEPVAHLGDSASAKGSLEDDATAVQQSKKHSQANAGSVMEDLPVAADPSFESVSGNFDEGHLHSASDEPSHLLAPRCSSPLYQPPATPTSTPNHLATPSEGMCSETQQLDQSTALKKALEDIVNTQAILEQAQVTAGSASQNTTTSDVVGEPSLPLPEITTQPQTENHKPATGCLSSINDTAQTVNNTDVWYFAQDQTYQPMDVDMEPTGPPEEPSILENTTTYCPWGSPTQSEHDLMAGYEWDDEVVKEILGPLAASQQDIAVEEVFGYEWDGEVIEEILGPLAASQQDTAVEKVSSSESLPATQSEYDLMSGYDWDDEVVKEILGPLAASQQDIAVEEVSSSESLPASFIPVNQAGNGVDLFQDAFNTAHDEIRTENQDPFQGAFNTALDEINTEKQAKRPQYPISNNIVFPSSGAQTEERRGINDFVGPYPKDPWESYWKTRAETKERFIARFTNQVRQMMYVSGETGEPSVETTSIIEDIVRQQVISMVSSFPFLIATKIQGLTSFPAQKLHRTRRPPRLPLHNHQRPNLPNPRRRSQSLSPAHLP